MTGIITFSSSWPASARHADRRVAADDLKADLIDHLRDRRIDLARHDRRTRLYCRQRNLAEPGARPHAEEPEVARDFAELDGQPPHRAGVREHITHALRHAKAIGRRDEVQLDARGQVLHAAAAELIAGIESRSDGRGTEVQFLQLFCRPRPHRQRRGRCRRRSR